MLLHFFANLFVHTVVYSAFLLSFKETFEDVLIFSLRKAPWSSGECRELTIRAIVLGNGLESQLHLETRWKDGPLDGRKITKIIKTAEEQQKN